MVRASGRGRGLGLEALTPGALVVDEALDDLEQLVDARVAGSGAVRR
jgi:hypothetical protein